MGQRIFVPSNRNDSVTACDTRSGEELWRFFADGPVRFAPVAAKGRVFFNSDDGFLYCVSADEGKLLWKVNGGPGERRILGNHRMISSWPARGGVVLHQDRLFFAASIWPFMGIFIHAVDPETGEILWTNSGDGTNYTIQPHDAPAFAGLVPQGHLAADGDAVLVPGGRSTPGLYETGTGRQILFNYDKRAGGHDVGMVGDLIFAAGHAYTRAHGRAIGGGAPAVFDEKVMLAGDPQSLLGRSADVEFGILEKLDKKGKLIKEVSTRYREVFKTELSEPIPGRWFLKAGERYYAGGANRAAAYEVGKGRPVWSAELEGTVASMLAGDDRLFVVTEENRLFCYGPKGGGKVVHHSLEESGLAERKDIWTQKAAKILSHEGAGEGCGIVLGIGNGRLIEELIRQSRLHVVAIDEDAKKVREFRDRMAAAGLYGERCAAILDDPLAANLPAYVANLIVSETIDPAEDGLAALYRSLRPYGGIACLALPDAGHRAAEAVVAAGKLARAKLGREGGLTTLVREGALPGADDWTHQYANAAQTVVSGDQRVKAPFGVLWFGGPSHEGILPRHGHGPSPQVAGGRLFIEGADKLRAVDVYTGRLLWEREMKGFGEYYDITDHFPGAGEIGSNYVSLPDRIYAVYGPRILELDTRNGKTLREFQLPPAVPGEPSPFWGHAAVSGDFLIATSTPVAADGKKETATGDTKAGAGIPTTRFASGSRRLVVFDRRSGEKLWERAAEFNFRHNNIAVSGDRVFCVDRLTPERLAGLARRGIPMRGQPALYALDLKTGEVLWETRENVFGTFLNYSAEHDVLLQGGSAYRDRAADETKSGLMALRGSDGSVLWHDPELEYNGPCLLWRDRVLTNGHNGFGLELLTGRKTGWEFSRMYGCNTAIGSRHLMTFRSGAAGFCDLANDSGTGNLGGFKSSCTNNLIPADGVLNAPDYTRTCTCAYQNQTSLALVHMPEAEFWTFGGKAARDRIGINFGAPGDRRSDEGTLFCEYPEVGGDSDSVKVKVEGQDVSYSRVHASLLSGDAPAWIAASCVEGVSRLSVDLPPELRNTRCRLRLYFAELEPEKRAERRFDVIIDGDRKIADLEVRGEKGAREGSDQMIENLKTKETLTLEFSSAKGSPGAILSGLELVRL